MDCQNILLHDETPLALGNGDGQLHSGTKSEIVRLHPVGEDDLPFSGRHLFGEHHEQEAQSRSRCA